MLTADEICEITGVSPNSRQAWAKAALLRQRRASFEEIDALEVAIYAALRAAAGPSRGKAAWGDLRSSVQEMLLRSPPHAWIVISARGTRRHELVFTPARLARAVDDGRPVHVIKLTDLVTRIRREYRRVLATKREAGAGASLRRLGGA